MKKFKLHEKGQRCRREKKSLYKYVLLADVTNMASRYFTIPIPKNFRRHSLPQWGAFYWVRKAVVVVSFLWSLANVQNLKTMAKKKLGKAHPFSKHGGVGPNLGTYALRSLDEVQSKTGWFGLNYQEWMHLHQISVIRGCSAADLVFHRYRFRCVFPRFLLPFSKSIKM